MSEYNDREGSVASVRHQLHLSPAVVHCVSLDTESKEQQLHPEIRCDDVSIRSCCVIQLRFPIAEECILKAKASEEFKRDVFESDHPWKDWVTFEVYTKEGAASPEVVRRLVGMGLWLVKKMLAPEFAYLASEIEGLWRQILEHSGFGLLPIKKKKLKFVDSMDKELEQGEAFTRDADDPSIDDPEYPRMFLENRTYFSDKFKKLHMGVGVRQDGLQFLRCYMIPKPEYDMPIFNVDMMGTKRISLGSVDLFPVTADQSLPDIYAEGMQLLQRESIDSNRSHPNWTSGIRSPFMITFAPKDDNESVRFLSYTSLLSKVYMKTAEIVEPLDSKERQIEIASAHKKFLIRSRNHEQLRMAIEKSFGENWVNGYLCDYFSD